MPAERIIASFSPRLVSVSALPVHVCKGQERVRVDASSGRGVWRPPREAPRLHRAPSPQGEGSQLLKSGNPA